MFLESKLRRVGKLLGVCVGFGVAASLLAGCSPVENVVTPSRTPVERGSSSAPPAGNSPATEFPRQVDSRTGNSTETGTEPGTDDDARKAELQRQIDQIDAESARLAKLAEERAALEAIRARKYELYVLMTAASSEVYAAQVNLEYWTQKLNDFAARGMAQSGAGLQVIAELNAAHSRLDAAYANEAAAAEAYNAAPG